MRPEKYFLLFIVNLIFVFEIQAAKKSVTITSDRDTTLIESQTGASGNGAGENLFVGRTNQGTNFRRRGLLHFDIGSKVPANSQITSAGLRLTKLSDSTTESMISVHQVLADWGEGTSSGSGSGSPATSGDATWIHTFFDSNFWQNAGGDFLSSPSTTQFSSATSGSLFFPSTTSTLNNVQTWLDDPENNFGWLLQGDETIRRSTQVFASRENPTTNSQPMLYIEFEGPDWIATPQQINFGEFEVNDEIATACVTITNIGTGTITITSELFLSTSSHTSEFLILSAPTSGTAIAAGNFEKVILSFDPESEGDKEASLFILTDDSVSSNTEIQLTGSGVNIFQFGQIQLSTDRLDLDLAVVDGIPTRQSIEIRNIGNQDLNFTGNGIEIFGPPDFLLIPELTSTTLAKNEALFFDIEFSPQSTGLKGAQLVITTDDMSSPTVIIEMNGAGAEEVTVTLTDGVDGYSGTSDTVLYEFVQLENGQPGTGDFVGNGGGQFLFTGATLNFGLRRSLIAFDLSSISPDLNITQASLKLNNNRAKGLDQQQFLHFVLQSWGEGSTDQDDPEGGGNQPPEAEDGEATWKYRFSPNVPWDQDGGDFATTPSAQTSALSPGQQIEFTSDQMLEDIYSWINGEQPNYGWMILGVESFTGTAVRYDSSDGLAQNRPVLELKIIQVPPPTPMDLQQCILGDMIIYTSQELQALDSNQDGSIDIGDILNEL